MTKLRKRNTYIAFIVVGVLAILGVTLASAFRVSKSTDVNVYPVTLEANIDLIENLQDVVSGDTIVNGVSFSRATDSNDIYVRADLRYEATGTLSDEDKRFLLAINYDDVATHEDTSYKWVRAEDGYYYLTDLSGAPLKVTNSDDYIFCSGLTYQGAKCINNDAPAPATLKLNAELQAIHAKDMDSVTLTDLSTLFNTYFGAPASLGYIVAFDTDDAGLVKAQTFLSSGLTVTEPPEPTKLGYDFAGWYTDPEFNTLYDFNTTVTKSFTLYAKFTSPIQIIQDGQVIKEVQNENYTLSSLILAYKDLQNTYNFHNDQLLSDNITLDDVLADDHKIYVEPVTAGLNYNKITNSDACRVGDDSLTSGNAMTSAVTDTDIVIADNYTDGEFVYPVTQVGRFSFDNKNTLTSINIPDSVTSIGDHAFDNCSGLTGNLEIPNGVTSIGYSAFYGCSGLSSITLPDVVTNIGPQAFENCNGLNAVYITDLVNWLSISFSTARSNPLFYAKNLYLNDTLVTSVDIPNTFTEINPYVFYYCKSLISVTIPNSVTSIGSSAFENCSGLTGQLEIPDSVTSIGDSAFERCENLTGATIGDGVTSIGNHAFDYCLNLTSIVIPDGVTSIGDYAFYNCRKLTGDITIPKGVTSIGDNAFDFCSNLTSITIGDGVTSIGDNAFYYCSKLTSLVIGDGVTSIGYRSFYNCASLTSITIPDNVESIGEGAFSGSGIINATIGDGVTSIERNVFENCSKLTSVAIGDGVTSIGYRAFYNCASLTSITIPDNVESIGENAFSGSGLTSVTIGDGVTTMREAFSSCSKLTTVVIGSGVTSIEYRVFYNCDSLISITIPYGITSIDLAAFQSCDNLTSVIIPDSVISIGDSAFSGCYDLTSVTIPDSVTSIGDSAFYNCNKAYLLCETEAVRTLATGKGISDASRILVKVTDSAINSALESQSWSTVNTTLESTTYNSVTYFRVAGASEYYC